MQFITQLNHDLDKIHLLKHPFYQAWNEGKLSLADLQIYGKEYYHHVAAFPRYISAIHSLCDDIETRQVLLGNLIEEEQGEKNHPELWLRFCEGLDCTRDQIRLKPQLKSVQNLVDGYFNLTRNSYAEGLGALYAYERQTPEVSKSKIDGLKKFYAINDERALEFFNVHMTADEWHSDECAQLLEKLNAKQQEIAYQGSMNGAKLLWQFLDEMAEIAHCE